MEANDPSVPLIGNRWGMDEKRFTDAADERPSLWLLAIAIVLALGTAMYFTPAFAQSADTATQALLRQQERERALREQQESTPDVRLSQPVQVAQDRLPTNETPCFPIARLQFDGEDASAFRWALKAADAPHDPATGHCLGTAGINVVMKRVQNALVAHGYVTTRVLAKPQDLHAGVLTLTVIPGRIRAIRFAPALIHVPSRGAMPYPLDLATYSTCVTSNKRWKTLSGCRPPTLIFKSCRPKAPRRSLATAIC